MNEEVIERGLEAESEQIELVECGEASKTTKGGTWYWAPEGGFPPFNRARLI
ncbi:MAG: hypothetical protein IRZ28_19545 [Steroidobacteraceae bacterium]|nr:hypothetical protein [Steroidobacteraceae bacterium]